MGGAARGGVGLENQHLQPMAGGDGAGAKAAETTAHDDQVAQHGRSKSASDLIQIPFARAAVAALDPCLRSRDKAKVCIATGILTSHPVR
jgi:hypothetical protein